MNIPFNRISIMGSTAIAALAIAGGSAAFALSQSTPLPSGTTLMAEHVGAMKGNRDAHLQALADKLGISVETLKAAMEAVKPATPAERGAKPTAEERDARLQALATELGISVDTLKEAMKQVALDQVAKSLADGKITQEEADARIAAINAGEVHGPGGPRGTGGHGGRGHGGPGMHGGADVAGFLGITAEQLRTELQSGKTLAQVAQDHGKSRDELKAFLTEARKAQLAQGVTDGKLTQAEADEKLAEFTARLDEMIDSTGPKAGIGGPRGPRGGQPGTRPSTAPGSGSSGTN
jgi:lambda repressor-like predicted transcriptional regulator